MNARLVDHDGGSAAAEMAMVLPLLLLLLGGAVELGNYFWSEHVLVKGVRDGALYAARNQVSNYTCAGAVNAGLVNDTKNLVRTGQLVGGTDRLPKWTDAATEFNVAVTCFTAAGGTDLGGIYTLNGNQAPVVTVTASLPYRSITGGFGFSSIGLSLNASQQAAVTGI